MSIVIEQTQQELHDAAAFYRNCTIRSIRLSRANIRSGQMDRTLDVHKALRTVISFDAGEVKSPSHEHIELEIKFNFEIAEEQDIDNPRTLINVECWLQADYVLRPGYEPSETEIAAFQKGNVVFNCWPFFREYVQNSVVRMDFPPPPVPFLRIQVKPEQESN